MLVNLALCLYRQLISENDAGRWEANDQVRLAKQVI